MAHRRWRHMHQGSDQLIHSLKSENYEPLSIDKFMRGFEDAFTGLGWLPGEYHKEMDLDIRPVHHVRSRLHARCKLIHCNPYEMAQKPLN